MHALHLAAECAPLVQTGGLGAAVGALPAALRSCGVDASVALPMYGGCEGPLAHRAGPLTRAWAGPTPAGDATVWRVDARDVPTFLVEHDAFASPHVYADGLGEPLPDARFAAFCVAALSWLVADAERRPDLLHVHDAHTGLVPALLRAEPVFAALAQTPVVLTVHGADHQGVTPLAALAAAGVSPEVSRAMHSGQDPDDALSMLRVGVEQADAVIAPSPTFARELRGDGPAPRGLGRTFRAAAERTVGILDGLDRAVWDPRRDPALPAPFGADDLRGKALAKAAVCAELSLDPARPLLAYVGRLMPENGVEILYEAVERLSGQTEATVAVLGRGSAEQEARLRGLATLLRTGDAGDRLAVRFAFDQPLAHRLVAGADAVLCPDRTAPAARTAMTAMAYGAVPVVHAVGALKDAVCPDGEPARGVCFDAFTTTALTEAVVDALDRMQDADAWAELQARGLAAEFSWLDTATRTAGVYRDVLGAAPHRDAGRHSVAV